MNIKLKKKERFPALLKGTYFFWFVLYPPSPPPPSPHFFLSFLRFSLKLFADVWLNIDLMKYFSKKIKKCTNWYLSKVIPKPDNVYPKPHTRFFYKQPFFSTQPQCCLPFSWIELQVLLRCCLIHKSLITLKRFLYFLCLCPCLDLGLFMWSFFHFYLHFYYD